MRNALQPSSDTAAALGRAAHDLGLAGLLGGQLFGRLALHPAVAAISEPRERGEVVNAAWRRYGAVNGLGLLAVAGGWAAARAGDARDANLTGTERGLARVKDGLVGALVLTGVATAAEGIRFGRQAPDGGVPLRDGDHVAPNASPSAGRRKRRLNRLGLATIGAEVGLVAVDAALSQVGHRRAPLRRRLRRW